MNNEILRQLHRNNPGLARMVVQNPEAMRRIERMEDERIAKSMAKILQSAFRETIAEGLVVLSDNETIKVLSDDEGY